LKRGAGGTAFSLDCSECATRFSSSKDPVPKTHITQSRVRPLYARIAKACIMHSRPVCEMRIDVSGIVPNRTRAVALAQNDVIAG